MNFKSTFSQISNQKISLFLKRGSFILSIAAISILIFDLGFFHAINIDFAITNFYFIALFLGIGSILTRYFISKEKLEIKVRIFDGIIFLLFFILFLMRIDWMNETFPFLVFFNKMGWVYLALILYFIRESSVLRINTNKQYLNPAQLFIVSFFVLIVAGTVLLMLPRATHEGISALDALFTATSAVCVTGLIVVDTGSYFTEFGQIIIMILIQLGGLGIMTFASYFSYFFRGKASYENQLMLKDITNSEKIGDVFNVLKKIVLLTLVIESIGAFFIYLNLDPNVIASVSERIFFSIFHAISGFCNAGFSTLEYSLFQPGFRFNYPLHLILSGLFILGGIGFPIIFNIYKYIEYTFKNKILKFSSGQNIIHSPWILNLNTRIVLITTFLLSVFGTIFFYYFEYNNTLKNHSDIGKLITAFFGAVTPRTAGFNSIDTAALTFPTLMIIIILMWIGASPASTGGGIKTSTFAIATLNFFSIAKGKDRIEVFNRELSDISIKRAFSIMTLSLMVIGTSIFLIASFENDKTLMSVAFETFSAYSTVGLSLGITPHLSAASKLVIIATMFIGRVSMLTILIALLRKVKHLNYKYPTEEILIN